METTERIVEAYVRYVKGWATIPNIKCSGQHEIDLLAIDPVALNRYHIETGVSVSVVYSKLTAKPYSDADRKQRGKAAGQRRTIGYFAQQKFNHRYVRKKLKEFGFRRGKYEKIIVSWGWTDGAAKAAKRRRIELWDFRDLMREIARTFREKRTYFTDDTMRTLHLFSRAGGFEEKQED